MKHLFKSIYRERETEWEREWERDEREMFENSQTLTLLVSVALVRCTELPWEWEWLVAPDRRGEGISKWDFLVPTLHPPSPLSCWHILFPVFRDPFILKDVSIHPAWWVSPFEQVWWRRGSRAGSSGPDVALTARIGVFIFSKQRSHPPPSCLQTFYNSNKTTLGKIILY